MDKQAEPQDAEAEQNESPGDSRRARRRLAMQLLYQIDVTECADRQTLLEDLAAYEQAPDSMSAREAAVNLALGAWHHREQADAWIAELAPAWPTHRQPPVDRAILRLGCYEMHSGHAPPSVAINEAVELAKRYCAEQSPAFINGVLDKVAKRIELPSAERTSSHDAGNAAHDDDNWLHDAIKRDT